MRFIVGLLVVMSAWPAAAQDDKKTLPRVLIIGDHVYSQARGATAELKGQVEVVFASWPRDGIANSTTALELMDQLLGRVDRNGKPVAEDRWPTWDLIHFNVGLGDMVHRMPGIKSVRVLPYDMGGVVATDPEQYEKNLIALIKQFKNKAPGAKLVWANTTPIRHSSSRIFKKGMELEYNQIAERVMKQHGVAINDMYAYAESIMNMDKPASHGADPFSFDKKPLHPPVVEAIKAAL